MNELTFRKRSSSSHAIIISLCCITSALAVAACTSKDLRPEAQSSSTSNVNVRKCEEWEQAQASGQGLGWDLVYESALKRNSFGPDSPMWKWIHEDGPAHPSIRRLLNGKASHLSFNTDRGCWPGGKPRRLLVHPNGESPLQMGL